MKLFYLIFSRQSPWKDWFPLTVNCRLWIRCWIRYCACHSKMYMCIINSFCNQIPSVKMYLMLLCCSQRGIFSHFTFGGRSDFKMLLVFKIPVEEKHISLQENKHFPEIYIVENVQIWPCEMFPKPPYIYLIPVLSHWKICMFWTLFKDEQRSPCGGHYLKRTEWDKVLLLPSACQ